MTQVMVDNPVPVAVRNLMDVFEQELKDVRFPDVDRQVLLAGAETVRERAEEAARLEAQLLEARTALAAAQDALVQRAQRALSYARVYAEEDAALLARLDAVGPLRARRQARTEAPVPTAASVTEPEVATAEAGRRGRKPRARAAGMLFQDTVSDDGGDGAAA